MDYTILRNEITTDPLGRGYAGMTDQQIADSLNAKNRVVQGPVPAAFLVRWSAFTDAFTRLESAVSSGQQTKRRICRAALEMTRNPHIPALDVNDAQIAGLLAALVSELVFTQAEVDSLKVYGQRTGSRAEELKLPFTGAHHVEYARAM